MDIGLMRDRLSFYSKTTKQDTYGQPKDEWTIVKTVDGIIEDLEYASNKEGEESGKDTAFAKTRIVIREEAPVITESMKLTYRSEDYDVVSASRFRKKGEPGVFYQRLILERRR